MQKDGPSALIDLLAKAHDDRRIANLNGFPIAGCQGKRHIAARLHLLRSHHSVHRAGRLETVAWLDLCGCEQRIDLCHRRADCPVWIHSSQRVLHCALFLQSLDLAQMSATGRSRGGNRPSNENSTAGRGGGKLPAVPRGDGRLPRSQFASTSQQRVPNVRVEVLTVSIVGTLGSPVCIAGPKSKNPSSTCLLAREMSL